MEVLRNRYHNTKIYKLEHLPTGWYYIGSTTRKLCQRLDGHKQQAKYRTSAVYSKLNELGWEDVKIVLIEEVKCENREEQLREENAHIVRHRGNPLCLNTVQSHQTREEMLLQKKQYYIDNIEKIKEYKREYQLKNKDVLNAISRRYASEHKEQIKERKDAWGSERVECECGCFVRRDYLNRHKTMKKHLENTKS